MQAVVSVAELKAPVLSFAHMDVYVRLKFPWVTSAEEDSVTVWISGNCRAKFPSTVSPSSADVVMS